jgi:putative ABC transport system permease protein
MNEQPDQVQANNVLLKTELLKHTEIEAVTTSFQLPGDAIRDMVPVIREDDMDEKWLPVIIAGDDFLPFFNIQFIIGRGFLPCRHDYQTEKAMMSDFLHHQKQSEYVEEYTINRKALALLGFGAPEEAVGKMLRLGHGMLGYICRGVIVGVTDDFNYTGLYNESIPLLIMQRRVFQHCIMVRLDSRRFMQARNVFEKVWKEVNPEYPAHYVFMNDVFGRMYRNEMNAQQLVYVFSLLCFVITNLGLIVFMAFIIQRRTREIAIRKVHGAGVSEIIGMLNMNFIRYIALAFVIAVPVAWYIMHWWMERFAYRTSLAWWIFALAGLTVLLVSVVSVSLQSWHAANINPVHGITKS